MVRLVTSASVYLPVFPAELVGAPRELESLFDRLRGTVARDDGRLVEDGKFHAPAAPSFVVANAQRRRSQTHATVTSAMPPSR